MKIYFYLHRYWLLLAGIFILGLSFAAIGMMWSNVQNIEKKRCIEHHNLAENMAETAKTFIDNSQTIEFKKMLQLFTGMSFVDAVAVYVDKEMRVNVGEQAGVVAYMLKHAQQDDLYTYLDKKNERYYVLEKLDENKQIVMQFSLQEFHGPKQGIQLAFAVIMALLIVLAFLGYRLFQTNIRMEAVGKELFKTNIQLERVNIDLAKTERTKSKMIRAISHDAMHTLTAIYSKLFYLLNQKDGNVTRTELKMDLKNLRENAHAIERVLENLKENERLNKGEVKILQKKTELLYWIRFVKDNFEVTLARKKQQLELVLDKDEVPVMADKELLKSVLINLVDNAIKYSSEGKCIKIWVEDSETLVSMYIQDQGRGIAKDDWMKLFKPFVRLINEDDKEKIEGTGLGLSNARKLIQLHDGDLKIVASEPGQGTTFRLSLPRAE
jgi:signal transduction histidine kinase